MPITTIICPRCSTKLTTDIPIGMRATIQHRPGGDLLVVRPTIAPITRPERSERQEGSPRGDAFTFGRIIPGFMGTAQRRQEKGN